jgi:O-antigen/teichoic acid export membrane protein
MTVSIRSRFAFTVGTNLVRAVFSFVTGMLLARWLGPASYGNMAFLLGTFIGFRQLLDLGSSSAFFTFLSQRPRSQRFVQSFYAWLAIQFIIPLCIIGMLFPVRWIQAIWHGEQRGLVLLAFAAAYMQYSVWPVVQQAGESQRKTVWVQGVGVMIVAVHLLAVVLLWRLGLLGLSALFAVLVLEYLLAAVVAHRGLQDAMTGEIDPTGETPGPVFKAFLRYCLPLIPYAGVSFAYEFADRWLLQKYGGGVQQAYYAVGAQFAGIALIATTSILRIFWKEIAEANHRGDHVRAGLLYKKVSRLLFLVGAVIAGFLIPWSEALLHKFLGSAYVGGAMTLAIMFLYPVHQSMGQIGTTMLMATERVSHQVIIGIVFMILSMVVTYFVLAPRGSTIPGLGLASEGLAIKMLVMQFVQVNVIAYIIARIWHWPFDWVYQPGSLLGCLGLGWLAHFGATGLVGQTWNLFLVMGVGGLFYLVLMCGFVYAMPSLAGLTRAELVVDVRRAWSGLLRLCGHWRVQS